VLQSAKPFPVELGVGQPQLPHPQLHKTIIAKSAAMRKRKNVYMAIATDIPLSEPCSFRATVEERPFYFCALTGDIVVGLRRPLLSESAVVTVK
jgi:hypothetical protein